MDVKLNRKDVIIDNLAYENLAQEERIKELENRSKAMLQELIERYSKLAEFIEEMKKDFNT